MKLDKAGEFTGRAALEKVAREGTSRTLVGLEVRGRGIARHGYPVHDADGATGVVTVGHDVADPGQGDRDGLRRVGRCRAGTMLDVEIREARVPAEVVPLPFYRRPT